MSEKPVAGSAEYVLGAFQTLLQDDPGFQADWLGNSVNVYIHEPFNGISPRAVLIQVVSAIESDAGSALLAETGKKGLRVDYRLSFICAYDDPATADQLSGAVTQIILDNLDALRDTYGLHKVRKVVHVNLVRDPTKKEERLNLDFKLWTQQNALT